MSQHHLEEKLSIELVALEERLGVHFPNENTEACRIQKIVLSEVAGGVSIDEPGFEYRSCDSKCEALS